jgi:GntR family transcriptional regulator
MPALYRIIADDLRRKIESGDLAPGDKLPGEEDLRTQYGGESRQSRASRNTVREALRWLVSRGLVETRSGQGTFVLQVPEPFVHTLSAGWQEGQGLSGGEGKKALAEVRARKKKPHATESLRVEPKFAEGEIAALLDLDDGTGVILREQQFYIDGNPWSIQKSYYPMRFLDMGAHRLRDKKDIEDGVISYLNETLGIRQIGIRDQIVIRPPEDEEITHFHLPDDGRVQVAVIYRTGFADDKKGPTPFRLTVTVFPADRNQFVVNAGQVGNALANPIIVASTSAEIEPANAPG